GAISTSPGPASQDLRPPIDNRRGRWSAVRDLKYTGGYFLSSAPGAGELLPAGRSEFQVSVPHFHFPSAFFSQTSTYLPRSLTGFPLASFMVSSYVPLTKPRSPDFATSTLVAFQLMTKL